MTLPADSGAPPAIPSADGKWAAALEVLRALSGGLAAARDVGAVLPGDSTESTGTRGAPGVATPARVVAGEGTLGSDGAVGAVTDSTTDPAASAAPSGRAAAAGGTSMTKAMSSAPRSEIAQRDGKFEEPPEFPLGQAMITSPLVFSFGPLGTTQDLDAYTNFGLLP